MESPQLVIILALIVFGAVIAFVLYLRRSTAAMQDDPNAPDIADPLDPQAKDESDADDPAKVTTAKPIPPMR